MASSAAKELSELVATATASVIKFGEALQSASKVGHHGGMNCCELANDAWGHAGEMNRLAAILEDLDPGSGAYMFTYGKWLAEFKACMEAETLYANNCAGKSPQEWCEIFHGIYVGG